jgi:hypothetical protein
MPAILQRSTSRLTHFTARVPPRRHNICAHPHSSLLSQHYCPNARLTLPIFTRLTATLAKHLPQHNTLLMSQRLNLSPPPPSMSRTPSQIRSHAGHSHNHDNAYLTSTNKNDAGVRITRIGLYVNLGMAIAKGIGGYYFNSKALSADAIHSLTDLVSDVMTILAVSWALRPPNEKFPTGYGKVESLGSLGVSGMLLATGAYMGWASILQLAGQLVPGFEEVANSLGLIAHGHGHDHSHTDLGPDLNAAWLAGGSILIKEWLYHASTSCLFSTSYIC